MVPIQDSSLDGKLEQMLKVLATQGDNPNNETSDEEVDEEIVYEQHSSKIDEKKGKGVGNSLDLENENVAEVKQGEKNENNEEEGKTEATLENEDGKEVKKPKEIWHLPIKTRVIKEGDPIPIDVHFPSRFQVSKALCKDPSSFTIPCQIGTIHIIDALLDLGHAINVMLSQIFSSLYLGELQSTNVILQLANKSIRKPKGVVEDILVKVKDLVFLMDFYTLDMAHDNMDRALILRRPFMQTTNTIFNMKESKIIMEFGGKIIEFNMHDALNKDFVDCSLLGVKMIDAMKHG
ncbi:uncharacterized protein LOC129317554 [Prosopis cineraria]|uniref:uncharacterized protein LOC129317554 n=1 Tax=Prosopis cineraria TaxID=364024 RepID=UPI00240F5BC4|nr:uncharacterized protein LOC129317554 [Prosopis cineraria]